MKDLSAKRDYSIEVVDEIFTNVVFRICLTIVRQWHEKSPMSHVHKMTM